MALVICRRTVPLVQLGGPRHRPSFPTAAVVRKQYARLVPIGQLAPPLISKNSRSWSGGGDDTEGAIVVGMRVHLAVLVSLGSAVACGSGGSASDSDGSSTTSAPSTGMTTAADGGPGTNGGSSGGETTAADGTDTTGLGGTAGATGSTGAGGTTGFGESTGSTDGESTGSTDGTTGAAANIDYTAIAIPGGLDRVRINKTNLDEDRCTWMVLVSPAIPGQYPGVAVPAGWSVESISISDVAAACSSDNPAMFGSEPALDANGTVTYGALGGMGLYPCTVDVDLTADFQGLLPGVPPMDDMVATSIPVLGVGGC